MPLFGGLAIPLNCLGSIFWYTDTNSEHHTKFVLRFYISLRCRLLDKFKCLDVVLLHAFTFLVPQSEIELAPGIAKSGRLFVQRQ